MILTKRVIMMSLHFVFVNFVLYSRVAWKCELVIVSHILVCQSEKHNGY